MAHFDSNRMFSRWFTLSAVSAAVLSIGLVLATRGTAAEGVDKETKTLTMAHDGVIRLHARDCAVHGKTLKFMDQEQALGWWNSPDDRAEWRLTLPYAGRYEVWLDWSCPDSSAGNTYVLRVGDQVARGQIASTRSWQTYRLDRLATLDLPTGDATLSLGVEGKIRDALADVRELRLVPVEAASQAADGEAPRLKALLIDGQNNHDWRATSPILRDVLNDSGRFLVDIATTPAAGQDLRSFRPPISEYQVIVSNYNGQPWPQATRDALARFVRDGGGLVIVHAANNAFPDWPEYNDMIGLGWRGAEFGPRLTLDNAGRPQRASAGEGPGAGHGAQHEFMVVVRDRRHPITRGMASTWLHAQDELYHGQRGPAANLHVLATAYAEPAQGGTGAHEPMAWVIPFGQGRVFTTVLGHADYSMRGPGFQQLVARGAEWAATGDVRP